MNRYDADDHGSLPADTASARWAGYKVVGGGNEYDLLERDGERAIQCRKCRQLSHDPEHLRDPFCPTCHERFDVTSRREYVRKRESASARGEAGPRPHFAAGE